MQSAYSIVALEVKEKGRERNNLKGPTFEV